MLKAVIEKDKYGNSQTHYYLTQGDSCTIYAIPYKDGERLSIDQITKCVFKLSDTDYNQEYKKELTRGEDKFILKLTTEETSLFTIDEHYYEFEYTLLGGEVQTPNQWKFDIVDQIIE